MPNASGAFANFDGATTGTTQVDISGGVTVGALSLMGTGNTQRTITLTNGITFNNGGAGATLSNTNSSTGTTNRLSFGSGTLALADNLTISNSGGSTNATGAITFGGGFSGTGNLTISNISNTIGSGQIVFGGAGTFTGTTTITKGVVTTGGSFGTGGAGGGGGSQNNVTLGSTGAGTLLVTGTASTFANNVTAGTGGALLLGSNDNSSVANKNTTFSGTLTLNNNITLTSAKMGANVVLYNNVISGTGGVTVSGTATEFTGANTFTGNTKVSSGATLILGPSSGTNTLALQNSTLDTSGGGTVAFGTSTASVTTATFAGLTGGNNLALTNASSAAVALTVGNTTTNQSYSGSLTGGGSLIKSGTNAQTLAGSNSYAGGTSVTGGKLIVDNSSGSGTGSDGVTVGSSGVLAGSGRIAPTTHINGTGVTLNSGASLVSGDVQSTSTVTGTGMTLDNSAGLSSILAVHSASLTFALGAGSGGSPYGFATPNTHSTFLSILGNTTGEISFTGANTVTIQDLTTSGSIPGTLSLRTGTPYQLISTTAGDNSDFSGLVTSLDGSLSNLTLGGNGYVIGVGTTLSYLPIALQQIGLDGAPLTGAAVYLNAQLYLYNGTLEVVPEPGTWALMVGSLLLLVVIQRSRRQRDWSSGEGWNLRPKFHCGCRFPSEGMEIGPDKGVPK